VQYAGVGWAVAELTPYVFHYLALWYHYILH
jgi:hypothetical protein